MIGDYDVGDKNAGKKQRRNFWRLLLMFYAILFENGPEREDFRWSMIRDVGIQHQLAWCILNTMDLFGQYLRKGFKLMLIRLAN